MAVGAKAGARRYAVLVQDAERTKRLVFWVMVTAKWLHDYAMKIKVNGPYFANENVWNVLSQP